MANPRGDRLLSVHDLDVGYGEVQVLSNISLEIFEGEIVALVGANGAGKTTLLSTISGLLRPRRGELRFRGLRITGLSPRAILHRGIVQVPQERSLFPAMTVWENVRMGGYTIRDRSLVERRLEEVCDLFPIVR